MDYLASGKIKRTYLNTKAPDLKVSGVTVVAGPALLELSAFFGNSFLIKVYLSPIPNLGDDLGTCKITIHHVQNKQNKNYYDRSSRFEKEIFQKVSVDRKTQPVPHLRGTRTVHLRKGLTEESLTRVKGVVSLTLPVGIVSIDFSSNERNTEKAGASSKVKLLSIEDNEATIHYSGKLTNYLTLKGYDREGLELDWSSRDLLHDHGESEVDQKLRVIFKGEPVKITVLLTEQLVTYNFPFTLGNK